ncbi:MAG TPA: hypothetical protein VLE43_12370, partial [Candidatus Saccharimonadia bacterium]|nr:hypothetical protein [Candidatus Saccharimonadia bacterium]
MVFLQQYKGITSSAAPSSIAWSVESHTPEQTTIVLHVEGSLRMRATFARPSHMCTTLMSYESDGDLITFIEAIPGETVTNLPFLAASYKNTFRGKYLKMCKITFSHRLNPGSMKQPTKPDGYTEYTDEAYRKRMEEEAKARQKKT